MRRTIPCVLIAATLTATAAEVLARDATPADLAQLLSQPARASVAGVDANGNGVRDDL